MFYTKKDILNKIEESKLNNSNASTKAFLLITSVNENCTNLTSNQLLVLSMRWKTKIKKYANDEEVGHVLNPGNIFLMIDKQRKEDFLSQIRDIRVTKGDVSSLSTEALELTDRETNAILKGESF